MKRSMLTREFLSFLEVLKREKGLKREARRIVEGTIQNIERDLNE